MDDTLGGRISQARRRSNLTQEELAERAGVSLATVRKLEQGQRAGARISTLHALARGLGINTSELFEGGAKMYQDDQEGALVPLRRLLVPGPGADMPSEAPLALPALQGQVIDATRLYHRNRFPEVIDELPGLLRSTQVATEAYEGEQEVAAWRLRSHALTVAGSVLIQLRHEDLATDAIRQSMEAAARANDDVLRASGARYYTWIFTRQGRFTDAENTSVRMAELIEPSITTAPAQQLAVWGRLLTGASSAAARNNRPQAAQDLLTLARTGAARIERDRMDYDQYWSAFGPTTVSTMEVENAMTMGDAELAIHLAADVTPTEHMPTSNWSRHLLCVAEAQTTTRGYSNAIGTLGTIRRTAPEWLRNQRLAKHVVSDLLDSVSVRRAKTSGLAGIAEFMDVRP